VFLTAGLPSTDLFVRLACEMKAAGADIMEIGVPFSDPIADGPVIQASSRRALEAGVTLERVMEMTSSIGQHSDIPIILMGYANPFLSYGLDAAVRRAASAGAAGMIIPDLPPEEAGGFRAAASAAGLSAIFLASPTTPDRRIGEIDALTSGFVYGISTLGVTGARSGLSPAAREFLTRARRCVTLHPLLAGFGIASADTAREAARLCDGVIVGSALVERLDHPDPARGTREALALVSSIRAALDSIR
jgi:tryptophan synthase alpha chain